MTFKIIGEPLPVVICDVAAGESLITERGSMSWMTPNMKMETTSNGGLGKAFGRMFADFLESDVPKNPVKAEFYLPNVPKRMIAEGRARVRLLHTTERWYGMTYREDAEKVRAAIRAMKESGVYPQKLWE